MRTNALTKALMAAVGLWALPAMPGPDTYLVGTGQDGTRTVAVVAGGTVINNYAQVKAPLAPGDTTIRTSLATSTSTTPPIPNFRGPTGGTDTEGDLVLIIQTTGVVPVTVPGSPGPIYLEGGAVGRWELARLTTVAMDEDEEELTLTLDRPLKHSYAADVTQVVRVPEYTSLTLSNNAVVRAKAWDPDDHTGGILVFLANGAVTLNAGSRLSAEGAGFRGGRYEADTEEDEDNDPYVGCPVPAHPAGTRARTGEGIDVEHPNARGVANVANGGGGGVCVRAGGGGGGNTGAGGLGGFSSDGSRQLAQGRGGAALSFSPLTHLLMGGGGGAGHGRSEASDSDGGHGGGIIFVRARSVSGAGTLIASGQAGKGSEEAGAGGGGAGGSIYVRTLEHVACGGVDTLNARGGSGGDADDSDERGPGGGGGGGRILVQSTTANDCVASVNVSNGFAGNAVEGGHFGASPEDDAFPHTGLATLMQAALAAPVAPVIAPGTPVTTNNPLPVLTGTGTAGTEVVIYAREGGVPNGPEYGRASVGTTSSTTAFSVTLSRALPTGNTVLVAVTEAQGLQGPVSNAVTYTVDTSAPDTHFTTNGTPTSPSRLANAVFQFASNETSGITFQCVLQDGNVATAPGVSASVWATTPCSGTGTHTTGTLSNGETYTFWVRARDAAGNVDPTPARHVWRVDRSAPNTTFATDGRPRADFNEAVALFRFESNESPVTFQCALDDSATTEPPSSWADCATPYLTQPLGEGTYTLWVRARDEAGNVDATPASHTWTVDLTPPDTELFGTLPAAVNNANSVVLTFRALPAGDASDFECSLNGAAFGACASGDSFPTPGNATYTFLVRAKDAAGNVDPTPATHSWRTDKTRPDTSLSTTVGTLSNASRAGFEFDSPASDVAGFQCVLDTPSTMQAPVETSSRWQDCAASYLTPVLTDGTYTLWVRAKDAAENVDATPASHTWTVDLTPPDTELFGTLPAAVNNANSVVLTFRALPAGDASDFECSLNGAAFDVCESGDSFPTPGNATYTFLVRAKDAAGNVDPTPASYTWRTDKTRPDTSLSTTVGTLSNALQALFTFSSSATDLAGFQCVLEESPGETPTPPEESGWGDCAYSYLTRVLDDGTYRLWARAKDTAGNVDNAPPHHSWTVDLTPPETQLDSKPDILTNKLTATFAFSASEQNVQFECSYDGSPYFACSSPYELPNARFQVITEGDHQMLVRAIDVAGNRDETPASHAWSVVVGEVRTFIEPLSLSEYTQETVARFRFSSNLSNVVYTCELDGETYPACADSTTPVATFDNLPEGFHTLSVFAAEGEFRDVTPEFFYWTVDYSPPVAPDITTPSADGLYVNVRSPLLGGPVPADESLPMGTVNVRRDGRAVHSAPIEASNSVWGFNLPGALPDGEHTLLIFFTDRAGNIGPTSSRTFIVDATKPVTTLTVRPDGLTNQPQATFEFSSNEEGSTFACSLNGSEFSPCTSPHTVAVGDTSHVFVVRAIDRAGNVADVVGTHPWRVDTVEPSTSIVGKPDVDTNVQQAEFRFESNEAPVQYECSVNGAPFAECTTPYLLNDLLEGEHRLAVRARDEATNVDTTPEVHVWRVDVTAPLAPEITAPASDGVVGTLTPTFQGRAEPGSQVVLFVDGVQRDTAPVEPSGQWRLTLTTAISEGPHTVSALARDAAQNAGPQSQASAFTVDPSINIVREVSSRGGGLSCSAGGEGHVPLMLMGWVGLVVMAARRRRV